MADLEGFKELSDKLRQLASPKENAQALRESVSKPILAAEKKAKANIARISPGKTSLHKVGKWEGREGRWVSAGFAARNIATKVRMNRTKTRATAMLGVKKEAFYAVQFFELGTSRIPRQPWLLPAFQSLKDEMVKRMGQTLKARIDKIAAKRASGKK